MHYIDVFNGDADGICALVQLRLAEPRPAQSVTGSKRNINLLAGINATPDTQITVLDISFEKKCERCHKVARARCLHRLSSITIKQVS